MMTHRHHSHYGKPFPCSSAVSCSLADFPRLEQWSENTSLSDASLFMDGFLYISAGPAKATLDRRGRDGEFKCRFAKSPARPINPSIHL